MSIIMIDSDAFLCARWLGMLDDMLASAESWPKPTLVCTAIVGRNELNAVQRLVNDLEAADLLHVEQVLARTPAAMSRRAIEKQLKVDRGESESIAWAMHANSDGPVTFVSHDHRAREAARKRGLEDWDILDLATHWLKQGVVDVVQFRAWFVKWADDPHAFCRRKDFVDLDTTVQRRYGIMLDDAPSHDPGTSEPS